MIRFSALLFALLPVFTIAAQQSAKSAPAKTTKAVPENDNFSGTVTVSLPDSVTVVRKIPARPDQSRVFTVDQNTKIEGKLKVNSRVTVRFKADPDGVVRALRIVVRTQGKNTGTAGTAK